MRSLSYAFLALVVLAPGIATAQNTDGIWSSPFDHPASRRLHCAVYDSEHARLIVFGGSCCSFEDIWTLSLGDRPEWSSHHVSGVVPSHRLGASAMYDPVRDRVIMFGEAEDELWALSLTGVPSWTQLQAAGPAPPSRSWHSAVYDSKRDRMIVFGGNHAGTVLGDVWALDLANKPTWEQLAVPMPSAVPRQSHAATYDPVHDRMLVFGGERFGSADPTDTWELQFSDVATWREIPSTNPPPRIGGTLLYDPVDDRAVLLSGWGRGGHMQDVWVLPAGTEQWSLFGSYPWDLNVSSGFIDRPTAIYDLARRRIVAYSGADPMMIPTLDMDVPYPYLHWVLPRPWPRSGQSAIYDPKRERMIMSLGANQDGPDGQTWELPLGGEPMWSVLPTGGAFEQQYQTAIHDPIGDRMIVFGGWGSNETWELPLADPAWNRLSPGGAVPEFRMGHSAIYDSRRHRMIVFGGVGTTASRTDAFALALDGTPVWSALPPGPPRAWHSAIYDPVADRMLVFGGDLDRFYVPSSEVWSLSLAEPVAWTQLVPAGEGPTARDGSAAIYDPIRNRAVVYGGCCTREDEYSDPFAFGDLWELSLDGPLRWRKMTSVGAPPGRREANLVYDPPRDRAILSGGLDGEDDFPRHDEIFALTWGNPVLPSVSNPGDIAPDMPLALSYVISNPLPGPRAIEWELSSQHPWPGFPIRGMQVVQGGGSETVRIERALPEATFEAPNELTFTAGFSGAPGYAAVVRHLVLVAQPKLAIRLLGQTAGARPRVEFTLRDASAARLELLDVAGRRIWTRQVGSLGFGTHALDLAEGEALRSGIYFVRLLQAGDEVHARAAVIR